MTKLAAIIDYGVGNIRSVTRVIESTELDSKERIEVVVSRDHDTIMNADLIVFPGVGSFQAATEQLTSWKDELLAVVQNGTPTLGMCLGMQLMFNKSEEGNGDGLGIFEGAVTRIAARRVPHMGWNKITDKQGNASDISWAYFAHSFACRAEDESIVTGWTTYEGDTFASMIRKGNVMGTQFHPEKSDIAGVALVQNFISEVLS